VLSDPDKRKRYDQFGQSAFSGSAGGPGFNEVDLSSFSEMLEGIFGEVFNRKAANGRAPKDLYYDLGISFEEAALGTEKEISFERTQLCERCKGTRSEPDTTTEPCPACGGRGQVRLSRGIFGASRPCTACDGSGVRVTDPCTSCSGSGTVTKPQKLKVRIPAGIEDGAVRTIRDAGEQTLAGAGNLHVNVKVKAHALFKREGADIECEVPVSFPQAALGAQIEVPTLEGKVKMKLPAGTQPGKVFRLRGKGMPVFGGYGKGDQMVKILVEVPEKLSAKQRELLEALAREMNEESYPQQKNFLEKLKNLFG
jgi:molecular chaperone DnaJ